MAKREKGFSLIEIILAVSLFAVIASAFIGGVIFSKESSLKSIHHDQALLLCVEAMEAAKNIKSQSFSNLSDGDFGLGTQNGHYVLNSGSDEVDFFTRQITISSVDSHTKQIIVNVNWSINSFDSGSVELTTYATDWREP